MFTRNGTDGPPTAPRCLRLLLMLSHSNQILALPNIGATKYWRNSCATQRAQHPSQLTLRILRSSAVIFLHALHFGVTVFFTNLATFLAIFFFSCFFTFAFTFFVILMAMTFFSFFLVAFLLSLATAFFSARLSLLATLASARPSDPLDLFSHRDSARLAI